MRRKYLKGPAITSTPEAVAAILAGRSLFLHNKVENAAWLVNMNLRTINLFVRGGSLSYAINIIDAEKPIGGYDG